jgi:hypothetical protein
MTTARQKRAKNTRYRAKFIKRLLKSKRLKEAQLVQEEE